MLEKYGVGESKARKHAGRKKGTVILDQPEETLLYDSEKRRYQGITSLLLYLAQVTRWDTPYGVNQLEGHAKPI